jgi:heat shock protein HslJ
MFHKCVSGLVFGASLLFVTSLAQADEGFPFGLELTLDAAPMAGSKRKPTLDIGDAGVTRIELWCKGGQGQFSVAGETIVFLPGAMEDRACSPAQVQADDGLLAALTNVATWRRRGDVVSFGGAPRQLQFRINTN